MYSQAGPEISVASTKAMCSQLAALLLLTLYWGRRKGVMGEDECAALVRELSALPGVLEDALPGLRTQAQRLARTYAEATSFLYLGRGPSFPLALEGALKLKEISYIHAEGYAAGEMKHGPIAIIDENVSIVAIATRSKTFDKMASNCQEAKARGAQLIALTTQGDPALPGADFSIKLSPVPEWLSPIVNVIPLQLLAYHIADLRGCDVDQPRNLAKSVTVE
jgi:glucosamine--fructose-6-phosphate aminotransferase (isomerizing)